MDEIVERYWNDLSIEGKIKLLESEGFWGGFSTFYYQYIPEELKEIILRKINANEIKNIPPF